MTEHKITNCIRCQLPIADHKRLDGFTVCSDNIYCNSTGPNGIPVPLQEYKTNQVSWQQKYEQLLEHSKEMANQLQDRYFELADTLAAVRQDQERALAERDRLRSGLRRIVDDVIKHPMNKTQHAVWAAEALGIPLPSPR